MSNPSFAVSIGAPTSTRPSATAIHFGTILHRCITEELNSRREMLARLPKSVTSKMFRQITSEGTLFITIEVDRVVDDELLADILRGGGLRMLHDAEGQLFAGMAEYRSAFDSFRNPQHKESLLRRWRQRNE